MKLKRFMIGVGIGIAAGLLIRNQLEREFIAPEKALKLVKKNLSHSFQLTGSWIHMLPESFNKNELEYTVYRGGVTAASGDKNLQYDFVVDAKSGTLLELSN